MNEDMTAKMTMTIHEEKMYYLNYCKTCYHHWESETEDKFCPQCFTESIVREKNFI